MNSKVLIVMGSDSDWTIMESAVKTLVTYGVDVDVHVASAHRTPEKAAMLASKACHDGVSVIIAGAGMSAHLAGVLAAHTTLPVIGVPLSGSALSGVDALYATVQMPSGIPVATVAIDGAKNAAILAVQILALSDSELQDKLRTARQMMSLEVDVKSTRIRTAVDTIKQQ